MGLSNMLSKLFKKDNTDIAAKVPVKFKDFDSIILPPEPKTRGIFLYKTLNLTTDFVEGAEPGANKGNGPSASTEEDALLLAEDLVEEIGEEGKNGDN